MRLRLPVLYILTFAVLLANTQLAIAEPAIGAAAPAFTLPDQDGKRVSLADYRGKWIVLYFYPKDGTPGCTTEACEFRDNIFAFRDAGAVILGISVDDVLALAPDDVWAVGYYDHTLTANLRTAVWHWDGSGWSVIPSPSIPSPFGFYPSVLLSIDSAGAGVLFAVGEWRIGNTWFPLAMRWNGSSWSLLSPPPSADMSSRRAVLHISSTGSIAAS